MNYVINATLTNLVEFKPNAQGAISALLTDDISSGFFGSWIAVDNVTPTKADSSVFRAFEGVG